MSATSAYTAALMYNMLDVTMVPGFFNQQSGSTNKKRAITAQRRLQLQSIYSGLSLWLQQFTWTQTLFVAVTIFAAGLLADMFLRACQANMNENAGIIDFSISNVMIQPYNRERSMNQLLPAFMAMLCLYAQHFSHKKHALYGLAPALIGAPGVFFFDIVESTTLHFVFLGVLCMGIVQWSPEYSSKQQMLTVALIAVSVPIWVLNGTLCSTALLGIWVGIGELTVLLVWASTMFKQ